MNTTNVTNAMVVRAALAADAAALADIYNYYVKNTVVTFEEQPLSADDIYQRITTVGEAGLPWLVAETDGKIVGYAYATPWKPRSAYRFSVEITVYVDPNAGGQGWGTRLYEKLFTELRQRPVHAVVGGVSLPNPASIALHEKFGMTKVAEFKEMGLKFDRWVDVGYWQIRLPVNDQQ